MSKNVVRIDFQKLRNAAAKKSLSTYEIAKRDGSLSQPTVSKAISGKHIPTAVNLFRICDVLEIPIQDAFIKQAA
jgi:transcriptional regulator with XRE-family HTH domain